MSETSRSWPTASASTRAASRTAPALVWEGEAISYGELAEMVAAPAEVAPGEPARGSPGRHPREEVARRDRAVLAMLQAGRPFLLPSVELAPETLDQLFAQAGVSQVLTPQAHGAERASLRAGQEPRAHRRARRPVAAAGRRRRRVVHAHDLGVDGAAEDRPAQGAGRRQLHRLGGYGVRHRRRARWSLNYAPLNFDLCLLDIWTTLKYGGCVVLVDQDRGDAGRYLADLLSGTRSTCSRPCRCSTGC